MLGSERTRAPHWLPTSLRLPLTGSLCTLTPGSGPLSPCLGTTSGQGQPSPAPAARGAADKTALESWGRDTRSILTIWAMVCPTAAGTEEDTPFPVGLLPQSPQTPTHQAQACSCGSPLPSFALLIHNDPPTCAHLSPRPASPETLLCCHRLGPSVPAFHVLTSAYTTVHTANVLNPISCILPLAPLTTPFSSLHHVS